MKTEDTMDFSCNVIVHPKTDVFEIFSEQNFYLAEIRGKDNFNRFTAKHKLKILTTKAA